MKRTNKLVSGGVQGAERPRTIDGQCAARSDQGWRQQWGGDCDRAGRWLPRGRWRTTATQCATSVGLRGGGNVSVCSQHRPQPRAQSYKANSSAPALQRKEHDGRWRSHHNTGATQRQCSSRGASNARTTPPQAKHLGNRGARGGWRARWHSTANTLHCPYATQCAQ